MNTAVDYRSPAAGRERKPPRTVLAGFWACILIAVAVALRRILVLAFPNPSAPAPVAALDAIFDAHRALTFAHILVALAFVVLAPVALLRRSGWAARLLFPIGVAVGLTAFAMSAHPVGGLVEACAVILFDGLFLYWLWRANFERRQGDIWGGRQSLIRAVAILLGIATTRPVMGFFFATSRLTGWQPRQFFGIAFWLGFSINTLAVEWWLRRRRATSPERPLNI